ncbi:MAG: MalY/PatB family protein [Lachnospiraceae bacterium]
MSQLHYVNRKGTNCSKWDAQTPMFGEENLHAMWVADMDFQAPQCVTKAIQDYVDTGVFGYYRAPDSFYNSFIHWERTHHAYAIEKEWIRFSPGVVPAINWIIQMLTAQGDSILTLTPVYYPFLHAVNNNKRVLITSDLVNTSGIYTIDYAAFENQIITHHIKLFILCSPHNPVGRVWKKKELFHLLAICKKHHVYIISDEIHQDLTFQNHKQYPSATIGDFDSILITLTAASKTFNLAGFQNSFVILPDKKLRDIYDEYTTGIRILSGNALGYIAIQAAYNYGQPWLDELKDVIYSNYLFVKETFQQALPNIILSPLEGTYLLWIDFHAYIAPEDMKTFIQGTCKLALDYGDWFGGDRFAAFARMNLATSRKNVALAVEIIIANLKHQE